MSATRARREHTCQLCARAITAGEVYVRQVVFPSQCPDLDVPGTYKAHTRCDELYRTSEWFYPGEPSPDPGDFRAEVLGEVSG